MSKIADYIEQKKQQRETQTVADFARELKKTPDALLSQLQKAGVQKNSQTDLISEADKKALLHFLRTECRIINGIKRKKAVLKKTSVACESATDLLLKAVLEDENGAEWDLLNAFAEQILAGSEIDPNFQTVINLLVTEIVFCEALPLKKRGRPKSENSEEIGLKIAQTYWDFRDKGESYSSALNQVAEQFHKDERHIMRLVNTHKKSVGEDFQEREANRRRKKLLRSSLLLPLSPESIDELLKEYCLVQPEFTSEDYMEFINERLINTIEARGLTGIKDTLFIASD